MAEEVQEVARLSPSIALKQINEGPLSAWASHRLLGNIQKPPTDGQIKGTIAHAALLGDSKDIKVIDVDAFRTTEAKELRDAALAEGKIPVSKPVWEEATKNAPHIRELIFERHGIDFTDGVIEQRMEWTEFARDGTAVECSGFTDYWDLGPQVVDVKSTQGFPTPDKMKLEISRSHAIFQDRAYRGAVAEKIDIGREEVDVIFLGVQTVEPFATCPVRLGGSFREVSELRWQRAVDEWADCLATGKWDVRHREPALIDAPGWLLQQELAEEALLDG